MFFKRNRNKLNGASSASNTPPTSNKFRGIKGTSAAAGNLDDLQKHADFIRETQEELQKLLTRKKRHSAFVRYNDDDADDNGDVNIHSSENSITGSEVSSISSSRQGIYENGKSTNSSVDTRTRLSKGQNIDRDSESRSVEKSNEEGVEDGTPQDRRRRKTLRRSLSLPSSSRVKSVAKIPPSFTPRKIRTSTVGGALNSTTESERNDMKKTRQRAETNYEKRCGGDRRRSPMQDTIVVQEDRFTNASTEGMEVRYHGEHDLNDEDVRGESRSIQQHLLEGVNSSLEKNLPLRQLKAGTIFKNEEDQHVTNNLEGAVKNFLDDSKSTQQSRPRHQYCGKSLKNQRGSLQYMSSTDIADTVWDVVVCQQNYNHQYSTGYMNIFDKHTPDIKNCSSSERTYHNIVNDQKTKRDNNITGNDCDTLDCTYTNDSLHQSSNTGNKKEKDDGDEVCSQNEVCITSGHTGVENQQQSLRYNRDEGNLVGAAPSSLTTDSTTINREKNKKERRRISTLHKQVNL